MVKEDRIAAISLFKNKKKIKTIFKLKMLSTKQSNSSILVIKKRKRRKLLLQKLLTKSAISAVN